METRIMTLGGRETILARENGEGLFREWYFKRDAEIAKNAIEAISLKQGTKYYLGTTGTFFILHSSEVSFHAIAGDWSRGVQDWKGEYKNKKVYRLPSWEEVSG